MWSYFQLSIFIFFISLSLSLSSVISGIEKASLSKSGSLEGGEGDGEVMATVVEEEEGEVEEGEESEKSDNEEAICPICLNELDEGEDLLVCSSCHNHLHQHCMEICKWVELYILCC